MPQDLPATIGRYEIVDRIGRGGMGTVFLARDPTLERTIAIKVLAVDADNDDVRERFAREARSAARLRHPNIVTIYDVGEERGQRFIAMEYVNGESVAEIIRRRAPFTVERKVRLMQELCTGLAYAHREGVIHRDIKPANLMLSADGELKILDFGLARLQGTGDAGLTRAGVMLGTPYYMSPEQIESRSVDQRSDIFSAGLVMYELLAYQRAFSAETPVAVLHQIVSTEPPSIRQHAPDLDPEIERIVTTAIARDPDRRYQQVDVMLRALGRVGARLAADAVAEAGLAGTTPRPGAGPDRSGLPARSRSIGHERLLRQRTEGIQAALDLAQTHFDAGNFEEAIADCERALLLDLENARALSLLDRSRDALEERHATSWIASARSELARSDLETANQLVDRALQLRPGMTEGLDLKRELDRRAAETSRALERDAAARRALELAQASFAEGAFEAALRTASEALAYDPGIEAARQLKERVAEALALRQREEAASDGAARPGESTVVASAPSFAAAPAPLNEGTMIIPTAGLGLSRARPSVRLMVLQSSDPDIANGSFELDESFEIGREARDLRSSDLTWSRRHALIEYKDRGYTIRDLGSSGGTFVNGRRVRANAPEPLFFGARITIGSSVLTFSPATDTRLPDLTGSEVAGRYILERLLRTSSKGAVYAARQKALPLRHALKLLSPDLLGYAGYLERFAREAEVASDLHHPHICPVQDYGETTLIRPDKPTISTVYLCLRLMHGGNLADRLDRPEPIALPDVARWIDRLGDALAYAHRREVVHGDIKPAAIVFDDPDSPNPYLTDFAIGQPREGDSSPGIIGTPACMAPEQWDGAPASPASDQFGLAVLAYLMVTGVRPFEGQDHPEIRRRNFARGPLPADEEAQQHGREGVRPAVARVLARALARKPDERYPSVSQFAQEFVGALTGAGTDRDADAAPRVFLSYHRAGGAGLPLFIVTRLRDKHGIDVFIDVQRIDGAVKFPDRLVREMRGSDVFVCLLGPATLESRWVRHEIGLACEQRKPMIPVFHEDYVLPDAAGIPEVDELLSFDGIRLMDQQNLYVEEGIDNLAKRIKDTLAQGRR